MSPLHMAATCRDWHNCLQFWTPLEGNGKGNCHDEKPPLQKLSLYVASEEVPGKIKLYQHTVSSRRHTKCGDWVICKSLHGENENMVIHGTDECRRL